MMSRMLRFAKTNEGAAGGREESFNNGMASKTGQQAQMFNDTSAGVATGKMTTGRDVTEKCYHKRIWTGCFYVMWSS